MRSFEIYVNGKDVACDTPAMHVPPDTVENIAVYLRSGLEDKYTMENLLIRGNPEKWLSQQRLNTSTIVLHDDNRHKKPGSPKFSIKLTPKSDEIPKVNKLDPIVVNE